MPFLLKGLESVITQVELDELCHQFHVPYFISMKVFKIGKLPLHAYMESDKIIFLTIVLECGVRLPLAPFIRRLLNEFPLHPLQVMPAL